MNQQPTIFKRIQECSICLDMLTKNIACVKLCGHLYHRLCIDKILASSSHLRKCPNCRKDIRNQDVINIVYNIDDCQENILAQQEVNQREAELQKAKNDIVQLKGDKIKQEKRIKEEVEKLNKMKEQIYSHVPDKLSKLGSFPRLNTRVQETYQNYFHTLACLDKYLPPENKNSEETGPFASEDKLYAYKGQFYQKKKHGKGKIYFNNGKFYEGTWFNDTMTGYGIQIKTDGSFIRGEFKNNQPDGYAEYIRPGKESYKGHWVEGKKHGKGHEVIPGGTDFNGTYLLGKKHGISVCIFPDGKKYEGNFINGSIMGKGKMTWPDGKTYDGHWVEGKMEGEGLFTWEDGRTYSGNYLRGEKHGYGTLTYIDESSYEGMFESGKQHGIGKCIHKDGTIEDVLCDRGSFKPRFGD